MSSHVAAVPSEGPTDTAFFAALPSAQQRISIAATSAMQQPSNKRANKDDKKKLDMPTVYQGVVCLHLQAYQI